jgi:hypothetical protein
MVVGFVRKAKKDYYDKLNIDLRNPRTCSKKRWENGAAFPNHFFATNVIPLCQTC